MTTDGLHHIVDRAYREMANLQWVRETYANSIEAQATEILYGVEWQAVENFGVYRRLIADNGEGMDADQLVKFMNTYGGGGKPIGGEHENFGIGSKTSLMPWNAYGIVVVSWKDGEPSMIWIQQDPVTREYGLKLFQVADETGNESRENVVYPDWDEESGCDWSLIKPDFIDDHGTVFVLMGNDQNDDSILGDPTRTSEASIKSVSRYLNRRLWEVPLGVTVKFEELRSLERESWPSSRKMAWDNTNSKRRVNRRKIEGSRHFVEYEGFGSGSLKDHGIVTLGDGTLINWYLWKGERPAVDSYAEKFGFIGALYKNELYNVTTHAATYRSFGIWQGDIRRNVTLIIIPQESSDGLDGVYPRADRSALQMRGVGSLPMGDWATEFVANMPDAIHSAQKAAAGNQTGTIRDEEWNSKRGNCDFGLNTRCDDFGSDIWLDHSSRYDPTTSKSPMANQSNNRARHKARRDP